MARLPEPRNAEGKRPKQIPTTGTAIPRNTVNQGIPPAQGRFTPFIPTAGDTAGDTVYFLVNSIFDPRTLQNTDGTSRFSTILNAQDYTSIWTDILYQVVFAEFRMRQNPVLATLVEMMEVIVDTTRCLGIYLSALSMSASRDPDMFARARVLEVYDAKVEMQTQLAYCTLPRFLVEASLKYIGLVDVSGSFNFQNVGFLSSGSYSDFTTLMANISSKSLARNFLRQIYPEIGLIGDPDGSRNAMDVLQTFINANLKETASGFVPYVLADQVGDEPLRMHSAGMLGASLRSSAQCSTITGWAVPGTGVPGTGSVRTWIPSMCVWKPTTGRDAAITRTSPSQAYSAGTPINFETFQFGALAANLVHEYNMNITDASPAFAVTGFNGTTGSSSSSDPLAAETTRTRVSAGFSLGSLTYDLQANVVSMFRDILLP